MMSSRREGEGLEVAHVLYMDLVGYSRLPMADQHRLVLELNDLVRSCAEFVRANAVGDLISLPTGDGMALVFFRDPEAPVRCALEVALAMAGRPDMQLRMGIHSGPVHHVQDINANLNVSGGGVNIAQRVMDCAAPGQILLSSTSVDLLGQVREWPLEALGEREIKHEMRLRVYSLQTGQPDEAAVVPAPAPVTVQPPAGTSPRPGLASLADATAAAVRACAPALRRRPWLTVVVASFLLLWLCWGVPVFWITPKVEATLACAGLPAGLLPKGVGPDDLDVKLYQYGWRTDTYKPWGFALRHDRAGASFSILYRKPLLGIWWPWFGHDNWHWFSRRDDHFQYAIEVDSQKLKDQGYQVPCRVSGQFDWRRRRVFSHTWLSTVEVPIAAEKAVTLDLTFELGAAAGDNTVDVSISHDRLGEIGGPDPVTRPIQGGEVDPVHVVVAHESVSNLRVVAVARPSGLSRTLRLGACAPQETPLKARIVFANAVLIVGGVPCGFTVVVRDELGNILATQTCNPYDDAILQISLPRGPTVVAVTTTPEDGSRAVTRSMALTAGTQMITDWYKGSGKTAGANVPAGVPELDGLLKAVRCPTKRRAIELALWFAAHKVPYRMGAASTRSTDTSGLVWYCFSHAYVPGYEKLRPPCTNQIKYGTRVSTRIEDLRPGDRLYFDTVRLGYGVVDHTGIYIGGGKMVEATPPHVRVTDLRRYLKIYAARRDPDSPAE